MEKSLTLKLNKELVSGEEKIISAHSTPLDLTCFAVALHYNLLLPLQ
jgi:hypothetical protein